MAVAAPGELAATLVRQLRAFRLPGGSEVVVAFSGGADSLGLLALLARLPGAERPRLQAIHVDHGLRPTAADEAVAALEAARRLGVEARVIRVELTGRGGVEAAARRARYRALAGAAAGRPILTAHTLDDQAETVLLRLARGSGVRGAGGIRPRTQLGGGLVLRPLLGVRRAALHAFVRSLGLDPVEDPSNRDVRFGRNRLRAEVVPLLEAIAPAAVPALARFSELARADERYLAQRAAKAAARIELPDGALDAGRLGRLPLALRRRIVRARIEAAGGAPPPAARVAEALALIATGGEIHLPGGVLVTVRAGAFRAATGPTGQAARRTAVAQGSVTASAELAPGTPVAAGGLVFAVEGPLPMPAAPASGELWTTAAPPFLVRAVRRGERLPVPGTGHRLASDLLAEARVPRELRRASLVVEGAGGPIWLVGVRPLCGRPGAGEPAWRVCASKGTPG
ncbi:tRNA lysidine(34) synthetase TilS [Vulgatibacter sp.]|uniref:tRNA lysidine(34) synthetase TilS n=1 Tax=Vulgatibacter sp. TaxID=1971226 RepID=UPI003568A9E0